MNMKREDLIKSLMKEVPELTENEANIILDSLIELMSRSISIGHDIKLVDFGQKPLRFDATKTDLSPLLVH